MSQIVSTVKVSMLDLQNSFSGYKVLHPFLRAKFEFVYLLKTAQQSEKGSPGCATPKENINIISSIVDEEHFLVFSWQYSLFGTQPTPHLFDGTTFQVGDEIVYVNGQSFDRLTHDEAVNVLKSSHHLDFVVRYIGKVPHSSLMPNRSQLAALAPNSNSSVSNNTNNPATKAPPSWNGLSLPYPYQVCISVPNREYCQGIHVGFEKLVFWPCAPFFA